MSALNAEYVKWVEAELARLEQERDEALERVRVRHGDVRKSSERAEQAYRERDEYEREAVGPFFVRDMARLAGLADDASMDAIVEALAAARAREQRLREALAFYANQPNAHGTYSDVLEDGGDRARAALAAEPAADGRGTRAFPHGFEGSGKRCLACGEPRWMHPAGSLVRFDSAAADEVQT